MKFFKCIFLKEIMSIDIHGDEFKDYLSKIENKINKEILEYIHDNINNDEDIKIKIRTTIKVSTTTTTK